MSWSISEVARSSGVTTRTLRHYDAIGLLHPARVGGNGYRWYERPQLLRLQRILLLRELGLGLAEIASVLDGDLDQAAALRCHLGEVREARDRLDRLMSTVRRTIADLQGGPELSADDLFDGFRERLARLEERLVATYGERVRQHFTTSARRTQGWSLDDHLAAQRQGEDLMRRMVALQRAGASPGEARVLDLVAEHHAAVSRFWDADQASYINLGDVYLGDAEQRAFLDALDPELAPWLRDAMTVFATSRL